LEFGGVSLGRKERGRVSTATIVFFGKLKEYVEAGIHILLSIFSLCNILSFPHAVLRYSILLAQVSLRSLASRPR
jgi:hypothetical protein